MIVRGGKSGTRLPPGFLAIAGLGMLLKLLLVPKERAWSFFIILLKYDKRDKNYIKKFKK